MVRQSTVEILNRILERVKAIDPVNMRKWFDNLHITAFDHGLMQIACPDQSCAEFLQDNCQATFNQAAQNVTGHLVSVQFYDASDRPDQTVPQQIDIPKRIRLHPDYTFESFVVGP